MPELPEVETVKRTLYQLVQGKKIMKVEVLLPRIIQRPSDTKQFSLLLEGETIQDIQRRGKFLRIILDQYVLVSHLRMEGRYGVHSVDEPLEKHTHVVFRFEDGSELRYKDVRQFGTMHIFNKGEELRHPPLNKLGLEPLDPNFTLEAFCKVVKGKKTRCKSFLLNQSYVTGLGNIYVDEALFLARIHPERTMDSLEASELCSLHEAIVQTLSEAVKQGGSSIKSYVNGQGEMGMFQQQLKVYGRKDEACYRCGSPIYKFVVGGRGTHICKVCQPEK